MSLQADTILIQDFELNTTGYWKAIRVAPYAAVTIQATPQTIWSTATVTIQRSNDGVNGFALETPQTLGPGADMSKTIDTGAFNWLILRLAVVEGAGRFADFSAVCKYDRGGGGA